MIGSQAAVSAPFRFDSSDGRHEYTCASTGEVYPHITGLLVESGWVDATWFTPESRDRGTAVHRLTAAYDLGALEVTSCRSDYRGWLLAHVKAMSVIRPAILAVEQPSVHPVLRFAGRPDREATVYGLRAVLELKSGAAERAHAIQTALQAILVSPGTGLPSHAIARFCLYLKPNGKFKLEEHKSRKDLDEAYRILREYCGVRA